MADATNACASHIVNIARVAGPERAGDGGLRACRPQPPRAAGVAHHRPHARPL